MLDHERDICLNCPKPRCDNCMEWRDDLKPRPEIEQIDLVTGEVLAVFSSVLEASRHTGIYKAGIYKAINFGQIAGGYRWRKTEVVCPDV